MKPVCESAADRIADLPVDVVHRILVFLPIKDAAKTSILSRKWRYRWRSIPELVFDDGFAQIPEYLAEPRQNVMSTSIMFNIYKSLLVHDGPVTKFELSISGLFFYRDEMDLILVYLSNKGIEDLTILFEVFYGRIDRYQMHSSLFSAHQLKHLKLKSCEVTPPSPFVGFSKLTHLDLRNVALPSDFFENFLHKYPVLECLRVVDCGGPSKLEIVAPFLKSFEFMGLLLDICFKCAPLLSSVSLYMYDTHIHEMVAFFAALPALHEFSVTSQFLKYFAAGDRNVPIRLPTPLHLLEVLKVKHVDFDGPRLERVFVCLIMNCPNLRRLTVTVKVDASQLYDDRPANDEITGIRLLEADDCSGHSDCLQHLKEFRIECSRGTQGELDLVRFVLASAPLLRRIHIAPAVQLCSKEVIKYMREVMRFTRLSKVAEVIYAWDDED